MTDTGAERRASGDAADLVGLDDEALVDAFRRGRAAAFDVLVERHRARVFRLCHRFAGNREDALDLAQDAFVRAFRGLARFNGQASFRTWLYRIAVNVCVSRSAARRVRTQPIASTEYEDGRAPDALGEIVRAESSAAVREAVRRLPPKQRATLILRVYHELSHEEIARILGTTVGAAKTNLFHALGNLRRMFEP
jgi:RNA polymerase sigma-70 factor (ECF subfamily)